MTNHTEIPEEPFGIIPLHATEIRNIVFENIHVEHIKDKLFCFRYLENIWGIPGNQEFPGTIADVRISNVMVYEGAGLRVSEFTGWSADKQITNVSIQRLRYGNDVVTGAAGMGLACNAHVSDVRFENGPPPKSAPTGLKAK